MLTLGSFAFAAPWLLMGLVALPILWWLLRVTPPAPRRIAFPALRLLLGIEQREETPARTPLWLILMRMLLAALIILALAQPLLNPAAGLTGNGPMLLVVDNDWAAARHWDERRQTLQRLLDQAERENRRVVLVETAPTAGNAAAPLSLARAADARALAQSLAPQPWPADRAGTVVRLGKLTYDGTADVVWLSDGLEAGDAAGFAEALAKRGSLQVWADAADQAAHLLAPAATDDKDLTATVRRAAPGLEEQLWVRAVGDDGRLLGRNSLALPAGASSGLARLAMPSELRNQASVLQIEGEASAGAALLLDERWRRRPVGIVSARSSGAAQPLLSGAYYLDKALSPFSEVRISDAATLVKGQIAVLALPDVVPTSPEEKAELVKWMENGGTVLRFAGPRLAEQTSDDLLPVTLRRGGRTLGGALSWEKPARLARFDADSPFAGLDIPEDVTVSRQVLAEPTIDLGGKTWARLSDGTPIVTAERRGKGWLVLVHTTADPEWSNLAISGLFVNMLRRVVAVSQGVTSTAEQPLPPVETLDGFGRLQRAPATAQTIPAGAFAETIASASHPPGFYGSEDARRALNLASAVPRLAALTTLPSGAVHETYAEAQEIDFRPPLLAIALGLALIDLVIAYALRGLLPRLPRRGAATGAILLALALAASGSARAARDHDDDFARKATSELHLAYVLTGIPDVDDEARAGLAGLGEVLNNRTAVEVADPMGIDIENDELVFFPVLYWPVVDGQQQPSAKAVARINRYLATGGTIVFDTRDQGESTVYTGYANEQRLKQLTNGINIPALAPVPPDHVLTKSFYLMQEFPGRWSGGQVWVEPVEQQVNDGVASVVVGANDWAGAWAVDQGGKPMYPVVPGGERQRELAYRFGINLVMYALTGNYKSDQVHVPAILERLGQ